MNYKIYLKSIQLFLIIILFICCTKNPPIEYNVTFVSNSNLVEDKNELLPQEIKTLLTINKCDNLDTIFIPKVSVYRLDLTKDNKIEIEIPKALGSGIKESLGTYGIADLQNDIVEHLPTMRAGNFLAKKGETKGNAYKYKKSAIVLTFGEGKKLSTIQDVRNHIDSLICINKGNHTKEIIINSIEEESTDGGTTIPPIPTNPCNLPTVPKALDLNDAIARIINTDETSTERLNIAEKVWNQYCHPNAYVALYDSKNERSKNVWDPGTGKNYFTNRLAILESIVSTSIFKVEFSKDGKIAAIHIIECQNKQELLQ